MLTMFRRKEDNGPTLLPWHTGKNLRTVFHDKQTAAWSAQVTAYQWDAATHKMRLLGVCGLAVMATHDALLCLYTADKTTILQVPIAEVELQLEDGYLSLCTSGRYFAVPQGNGAVVMSLLALRTQVTERVEVIADGAPEGTPNLCVKNEHVRLDIRSVHTFRNHTLAPATVSPSDIFPHDMSLLAGPAPFLEQALVGKPHNTLLIVALPAPLHPWGDDTLIVSLRVHAVPSMSRPSEDIPSPTLSIPAQGEIATRVPETRHDDGVRTFQREEGTTGLGPPREPNEGEAMWPRGGGKMPPGEYGQHHGKAARDSGSAGVLAPGEYGLHARAARDSGIVGVPIPRGAVGVPRPYVPLEHGIPSHQGADPRASAEWWETPHPTARPVRDYWHYVHANGGPEYAYKGHLPYAPMFMKPRSDLHVPFSQLPDYRLRDENIQLQQQVSLLREQMTQLQMQHQSHFEQWQQQMSEVTIGTQRAEARVFQQEGSYRLEVAEYEQQNQLLVREVARVQDQIAQKTLESEHSQRHWAATERRLLADIQRAQEAFDSERSMWTAEMAREAKVKDELQGRPSLAQVAQEKQRLREEWRQRVAELRVLHAEDVEQTAKLILSAMHQSMVHIFPDDLVSGPAVLDFTKTTLRSMGLELQSALSRRTDDEGLLCAQVDWDRLACTNKTIPAAAAWKDTLASAERDARRREGEVSALKGHTAALTEELQRVKSCLEDEREEGSRGHAMELENRALIGRLQAEKETWESDLERAHEGRRNAEKRYQESETNLKLVLSEKETLEDENQTLKKRLDDVSQRAREVSLQSNIKHRLTTDTLDRLIARNRHFTSTPIAAKHMPPLTPASFLEQGFSDRASTHKNDSSGTTFFVGTTTPLRPYPHVVEPLLPGAQHDEVASSGEKPFSQRGEPTSSSSPQEPECKMAMVKPHGSDYRGRDVALGDTNEIRCEEGLNGEQRAVGTVGEEEDNAARFFFIGEGVPSGEGASQRGSAFSPAVSHVSGWWLDKAHDREGTREPWNARTNEEKTWEPDEVATAGHNGPESATMFANDNAPVVAITKSDTRGIAITNDDAPCVAIITGGAPAVTIVKEQKHAELLQDELPTNTRVTEGAKKRPDICEEETRARGLSADVSMGDIDAQRARAENVLCAGVPTRGNDQCMAASTTDGFSGDDSAICAGVGGILADAPKSGSPGDGPFSRANSRSLLFQDDSAVEPTERIMPPSEPKAGLFGDHPRSRPPQHASMVIKDHRSKLGLFGDDSPVEPSATGLKFNLFVDHSPAAPLPTATTARKDNGSKSGLSGDDSPFKPCTMGSKSQRFGDFSPSTLPAHAAMVTKDRASKSDLFGDDSSFERDSAGSRSELLRDHSPSDPSAPPSQATPVSRELLGSDSRCEPCAIGPKSHLSGNHSSSAPIAQDGAVNKGLFGDDLSFESGSTRPKPHQLTDHSPSRPLSLTAMVPRNCGAQSGLFAADSVVEPGARGSNSLYFTDHYPQGTPSVVMTTSKNPGAESGLFRDGCPSEPCATWPKSHLFGNLALPLPAGTPPIASRDLGSSSSIESGNAASKSQFFVGHSESASAPTTTVVSERPRLQLDLFGDAPPPTTVAVSKQPRLQLRLVEDDSSSALPPTTAALSEQPRLHLGLFEDDSPSALPPTTAAVSTQPRLQLGLFEYDSPSGLRLTTAALSKQPRLQFGLFGSDPPNAASVAVDDAAFVATKRPGGNHEDELLVDINSKEPRVARVPIAGLCRNNSAVDTAAAPVRLPGPKLKPLGSQASLASGPDGRIASKDCGSTSVLRGDASVMIETGATVPFTELKSKPLGSEVSLASAPEDSGSKSWSPEDDSPFKHEIAMAPPPSALKAELFGDDFSPIISQQHRAPNAQKEQFGIPLRARSALFAPGSYVRPTTTALFQHGDDGSWSSPIARSSLSADEANPTATGPVPGDGTVKTDHVVVPPPLLSCGSDGEDKCLLVLAKPANPSAPTANDDDDDCAPTRSHPRELVYEKEFSRGRTGVITSPSVPPPANGDATPGYDRVAVSSPSKPCDKDYKDQHDVSGRPLHLFDNSSSSVGIAVGPGYLSSHSANGAADPPHTSITQ
eukprot:GEMP01000269.1.p1 GENE.GEMP01000269.1~~GEMP01000269.1.p1  ORF type:complete len:2092 (-),score=433.92 GEMP01000269.1:1594-7869(-)